ncbi:unnamed protein product [Phytophthora fragariaefolia]|uniref:Unnamed protein product n=1 Tax=Phytophthora fragariaefolia TaxID=1490495 RepID=A0A9W7DC99_9STRA|nr:unnamed protein product [Phytophthora fragariaefolia]
MPTGSPNAPVWENGDGNRRRSNGSDSGPTVIGGLGGIRVADQNDGDRNDDDPRSDRPGTNISIHDPIQGYRVPTFWHKQQHPQPQRTGGAQPGVSEQGAQSLDGQDPEHVIDFRDCRSTTMVRVPGSSGDSGLHRESTNQEDTKVKAGPEIEASTEAESSSTPLNEAGFADRHSAGRSSDDVKKEEDSAMDLEEKPRLPPPTPSGVPADRDERREPPDEGPVNADGASPTSNPSRARSASKKSKKARVSMKKMKAPESDAEDRDEPETWTNAQLEQFEDALKRKTLQAFLARTRS